MDPEEIKRARKLYESGKTLAEVRDKLVAEGHPSRSINTICARLNRDGCQMRRPGRRKNATM